MPKKAPAKTEVKTTSRASMLKAMNKKKAVLQAAAKTERRGFMDNDAIMKKLGLVDGDRLSLTATVNKVSFMFAKQDTNRPMWMFSYITDSESIDAHNGIRLSNTFILEETSWKTEEEACAELYGEFQGLGEDTLSWKNPTEDALDAAERITKDKPLITLSLSVSKSKKNDNLYLNIRPNGPVAPSDNSDLEYEEEESEEAEAEAEDFTAWVGGWIEFDDNEGTLIYAVIDSYDEEAGTFVATAQDEEEWVDLVPADVTWCEDQGG